MDEELILVPHPTVGSITASDSCILTKGDDPTHALWICARDAQCSANVPCTAGPRSVWIKQSDMTRYLALRLVS